MAAAEMADTVAASRNQVKTLSTLSFTRQKNSQVTKP
jgi:hypothetical protein